MPQSIIQVKATMRGLNGVTKKLDPQFLYLEVRESLVETLREMVGIVKRETPQDTGTAAAATYFKVEGETLRQLEGVVANPERYFSVLNYGRRAGAPMPPPEPIIDWAERHGISQSVVFPIQRAIAQRGIPGHHMLERALAEGRKRFKYVFLRRFISSWEEPTYD